MTKNRIVGLIPAAGQATRLGNISCSKEVLPIGRGERARPVSAWLIEQMANAGAEQIYFILRQNKWDIPAAFGHGRDFGVQIAYLMMDEPWGPPFTISQAFPFTRDATILLGFPDILIRPKDAFSQALDKLQGSDAQAVLGTFGASAADGCDQVQVDADDRIVSLTPKEQSPIWHADSRAWLFAAWRPAFSRFFEQRLQTLRGQAKHMTADSPPEWPVGSILSDALDAGRRIDAAHFPGGRFLDIGEPQRLAQAHGFPDELCGKA